jgi:hypothetical protein
MIWFIHILRIEDTFENMKYIFFSRFFVYSKSEYTIKIDQCVRPSVYPITFQKCERLTGIFLHSFVSSISRSSSKMRTNGEEMAEIL